MEHVRHTQGMAQAPPSVAKDHFMTRPSSMTAVIGLLSTASGVKITVTLPSSAKRGGLGFISSMVRLLIPLPPVHLANNGVDGAQVRMLGHMPDCDPDPTVTGKLAPGTMDSDPIVPGQWTQTDVDRAGLSENTEWPNTFQCSSTCQRPC